MTSDKGSTPHSDDGEPLNTKDTYEAMILQHQASPRVGTAGSTCQPYKLRFLHTLPLFPHCTHTASHLPQCNFLTFSISLSQPFHVCILFNFSSSFCLCVHTHAHSPPSLSLFFFFLSLSLSIFSLICSLAHCFALLCPCGPGPLSILLSIILIVCVGQSLPCRYYLDNAAVSAPTKICQVKEPLGGRPGIFSSCSKQIA